MNRKQAKIARILAGFSWFGFLSICFLYAFSMLVLPSMIHAWRAEGTAVPSWVVQVPIDASDSYQRIRFILFPLLFLLAVWMTIRARKASNL